MRRYAHSMLLGQAPRPAWASLPLSVLLFLGGGSPACAQTHWPQFRGPAAAGVSTNTHPPDWWSATENVVWKTDLPGRSWSSPVVWGDRVFLTTVINSGPSEAPKKGLYFGGERPEPPTNKLADDDLCLATPALVNDRLLLRTAARLYCLRLKGVGSYN